MTQRFHGIQLAGNSTADNFHFERLAATPAPLSYGRIWFNTTDKTFNFSSLDAGGAVTVNTFGSAADLASAVADLTAAIQAEATRATTAEQLEISVRAAAIQALNDALGTEVADRTAGDANEAQARIAGDATEAQNRTDAIAVAAATAAAATATEAAARLAGDDAATTRMDTIQSELDATQAGAGLNVDGTFTAPENTTLLGSVASLKEGLVALDTGLAGEVTARTTAIAALASGLANEAQARSDGIANLQGQLTQWVNTQLAANDQIDAAEQAARISGDAALQAELDRTQATIGTDTDGNLIPITGTHYLDEVTTVFGGAFVLDTQVYNANQAIAAEVTARTTAITDLTAALQTESTNRTTAVAAVQSELDVTQVGAGLETDGSYAAVAGSNYLAEATSLKDADSKLDAAAKAISNRVTAIESTSIPELQAQITAEVNRATAAESTNSSAATTAINAVAADLATETAARISGDAAQAAATQAEVDRATGIEAGLQSQITALVASSGEGAAALKTTLNATRFQYTSSAPATTHVVTHGMGTPFYSLEVRVKGTDGVWRNDIVPVEDAADNNSFTILLSEACDLRCSGQSNAALA